MRHCFRPFELESFFSAWSFELFSREAHWVLICQVRCVDHVTQLRAAQKRSWTIYSDAGRFRQRHVFYTYILYFYEDVTIMGRPGFALCDIEMELQQSCSGAGVFGRCLLMDE